MSESKLNEINNKLTTSIFSARKTRLLFEKNVISKLAEEQRFLFKYNVFDINQLIGLCTHNYTNYKQIVTILITKKAPERIKGISFINRHISKPFFFILLLICHPESKVKVKGIPKYVVIRLLRNNRHLLELARKIYHRMRG